jgi:hypothetical protein
MYNKDLYDRLVSRRETLVEKNVRIQLKIYKESVSEASQDTVKDPKRRKKQRYYSGYEIGKLDKTRKTTRQVLASDNSDWVRGYQDAQMGREPEVKSPLEFLETGRYVKYEVMKSDIPNRGPWMLKLHKPDGDWESSFHTTKEEAEDWAKQYMSMGESKKNHIETFPILHGEENKKGTKVEFEHGGALYKGTLVKDGWMTAEIRLDQDITSTITGKTLKKGSVIHVGKNNIKTFGEASPSVKQKSELNSRLGKGTIEEGMADDVATRHIAVVNRNPVGSPEWRKALDVLKNDLNSEMIGTDIRVRIKDILAASEKKLAGVSEAVNVALRKGEVPQDTEAN